MVTGPHVHHDHLVHGLSLCLTRRNLDMLPEEIKSIQGSRKSICMSKSIESRERFRLLWHVHMVLWKAISQTTMKTMSWSEIALHAMLKRKGCLLQCLLYNTYLNEGGYWSFEDLEGYLSQQLRVRPICEIGHFFLMTVDGERSRTIKPYSIPVDIISLLIIYLLWTLKHSMCSEMTQANSI